MSDDLFGGAEPSNPPAPKKKAPKLYPIFRGARRGTCSGKTCAAPVYWDARYKFPVSADCEGGTHPTETEDGVGCSHFANCPDVASFNRRGNNGR